MEEARKIFVMLFGAQLVLLGFIFMIENILHPEGKKKVSFLRKRWRTLALAISFSLFWSILYFIGIISDTLNT